MEIVKVKKLHPKAILPAYGSDGAAGADLYACLEETLAVNPGESVWVPTGIAMELPKGCAGLIYARSGLACKRGLAPANKVGVVDWDYRGEVIVVLHNHGSRTQYIGHGERIAQLLVTPVMIPSFLEAAELEQTCRDAGGFGSTGK